jgi:hypothetical protein
MAEQPSLGGAIALQGRNTIAEQLGRMQLQSAQRAGDVAAKKAALDAKRVAEIEEKFAIPKGQYHRLVLPEIAKTQAKYLNQVKTLKAERPNNWQNDIQNLSNSYIGEMEKLETLSKDLSDYDNKTATVDRGNTYFSNEWKKYNSAFETAKDLDDFKAKLAASGFDPSKATDFVVRPNGSISYTPFSNQKPLETIIAQVQKVPTIEFNEFEKTGPFNSVITKKVQRRPTTIDEANQILKNNKGLFKDINEIQTIEDVVDTYLATNPYGVRQYADQNNLNLRQNPDGTTNTEDLANIKQDIMGRVGKMTSPKVSERVAFAPRGGTVVNVSPGQREEGDLGTPTYNYGVIPSYIGAPFSAYRVGDLNITFEKPVPSVQYAQGEIFGPDYKPMNPGRLQNILPDGLIIFLTDESGNIVPSAGAVASDKAKIKGADLFMRFSSGGDVYYQKIQNYSNLGSRYSVTGKRKDQLEDRAKGMLQKASAIEADIENYKNTYVK